MRTALCFLLLASLVGLGDAATALTSPYIKAELAAAQAWRAQEAAKPAHGALFDAASRGDVKAVEASLAAGAQVNARNSFGETPLMAAAEKGHLAVVNALLAAGGDPNAEAHNGRTALTAAAGYGRPDVVQALLGAGAKASGSNSGALRAAAYEGHTDIVNVLLAAGADANGRNFDGATALMYAAAGGHALMVRALLAAGADANAKDKDGMDALTAATAKGLDEIALMLKAAGANPRSEQFAREVQEAAQRFAERLRETRDFGPVIEELFTERFLECHGRAMLEGKENGIFSQIGASRPPDSADQIRAEELGRHLTAKLNFFHLRTLHRLGTRDLEGKGDGSFHAAEREYPPGVYDLLTKNPGADRVKSGRPPQDELTTLERAVSMMREHLTAHPPEETELYRKNMRLIGEQKHNRKFWEIALYKMSDKESGEVSRCFGLPVRTLAVVKVPPFYQLFIARAGRRLKIGAMLCTEPPCAD